MSTPKETLQKRPDQYRSLSHRLPRFVVLGLAPEGATDELATALRERDLSGVAIDEGRQSSTIDGVFFGRESAFDGSKTGKLHKLVGRLGLGGRREAEAESIPQGVIVYPTIKAENGAVIATPLEQIEALCAENEVPVVLVDPTDPEQNMAQLTDRLFAPHQEG